MAIPTTIPFPSSSLRLSSPSPRRHHAPKPHLSFPAARAADSDTPPSEATPTATDAGSGSGPKDDAFDSRLSQVRLRYRSGTGKKAEVRKEKKSKRGPSPSGGMYLPPVALQEPVSEGLKVEFGFTPYSERMNGRIAVLGLTALLLVELATGNGVINYHTSAIVLIQVYFVAAVAALYAKYEKERVSVWPRSPSGE
ncbi:hypothetical protein BT93_G2160 [Corymbia citriodora subsp. variegata]|nr:hypothetical protein BT93_G2160 [Corymbia citriodora subsp. variegata]